MFEISTLIAFLAACIAIILAPGPAQALVLSRSISDGKKSGIMTALGLNVGTIFHALAAGLGLSTILATSALAFEVVKYVGAGYLIYLGLRELWSKQHPDALTQTVNLGAVQAFNKAVVTGILNPKVALFFLAFLPQFVDPARGSAMLQFVLLGLIMAALDILYETTLALVASALSARLTRSRRFALWRKRITGAVLIGLGLRLALLQRE